MVFLLHLLVLYKYDTLGCDKLKLKGVSTNHTCVKALPEISSYIHTLAEGPGDMLVQYYSDFEALEVQP